MITEELVHLHPFLPKVMLHHHQVYFSVTALPNSLFININIKEDGESTEDDEDLGTFKCKNSPVVLMNDTNVFHR